MSKLKGRRIIIIKNFFKLKKKKVEANYWPKQKKDRRVWFQAQTPSIFFFFSLKDKQHVIHLFFFKKNIYKQNVVCYFISQPPGGWKIELVCFYVQDSIF